MFAGMLFGILLAMKLWPDIPASRAMHRAFVETPLEKLGAMDRRHLIFGVVAVGMLFSFAELIMILGSSDLVMLMAWDVTLYVDAVIAAWTIAAVTRIKAFGQYARARIAAAFRPVARPRAARSRPAETKTTANDSDEDRRAWGYGLAA